MSDRRMQAMYETECPRCLDWITPGQWIVEESTGWCHAVCPNDVKQHDTRSDEEILAQTTEMVIRL